MRGRIGFMLLLAGVQGLVSGCVATRDYVKEVVGQQRAETDQRVTQVEGKMAEDISKVDQKLAAETQRVEGMGFRVGKLETSVDEVGAVARGAQGRADEAMTKASAVDERLTRLWSKRHARNQVEALDVTFRFNRADLDDGAQTALLNVIRELQSNPALTVDLAGYTDQIGPRDYNVQLAHRRVEAVRRFMVQQGVELPRISSIGLGPIEEKGIANDRKRRVTVKVMTPSE